LRQGVNVILPLLSKYCNRFELNRERKANKNLLSHGEFRKSHVLRTSVDKFLANFPNLLPNLCKILSKGSGDNAIVNGQVS
jgi:hypothetical protein